MVPDIGVTPNQWYFEKPDKPQTTENTASPTLIAFLNVLRHAADPETGQRVVVKIWIDTKKPPGQLQCTVDRRLGNEIEIYKRVLDKILAPGLSTNFIPFIASGECPLRTMTQTSQDGIRGLTAAIEKIENVRKTRYGCSDQANRVRFLVTQSACGGQGPCQTLRALAEILDNDPNRHTERWDNMHCIFFSLVWGIDALHNVAKISHNDLHLQNVVMRDEDPDRPTFLFVAEPNIVYAVPREWMPQQPMIFDWDRGLMVDDNHQPNAQIGMEKADLYRIFCSAIITRDNMNGKTVGWNSANAILGQALTTVMLNNARSQARAKKPPCRGYARAFPSCLHFLKGRNITAQRPFWHLRLDRVRRLVPEAFVGTRELRVFVNASCPEQDRDAIKRRARQDPRSEIRVIATVFDEKGKWGDFGWMIEQKQYQKSIFVFNDNETQFNAYHAQTPMGCMAGKRSDVVRPYQCEEIPRAVGIPTGVDHDFVVLTYRPPKPRVNHGYLRLTNEVKTVIDRALERMDRVINNRRDVQRIYYSADKRDGESLGTTFEVGDDVKRYIVAGIYAVANEH